MQRKNHVAALAAAALIVTAGAAAAEQFTIIALPDTQNYVNNAGNAPLFTQQTQWIADQIQLNGNPDNIVFVTHLGDVVSSGDNLTQWDRADESMSVLEQGLPQGVIPYGVLPGNHDYADTGVKSSGTDDYIDFFGPDRFEGKDWYAGADPSGNNSYQRFSAGGFDFLHLSLEWRPTVNVPFRDPSPVEWAQSIISANPGVAVIISTHEYIDDNPPGRSPAGEALWQQLVSKNDQVFMVLNGHYHSAGGSNDGEYHQVSQNQFGKDVLEVLQDYQDYPNGGDGWLRIITFDTSLNEVRFQTYSPVLDEFQTETVEDVGGFASLFTLPLNFVERFKFEDPPAPPVEVFEDVVFQEGANGYAGTQDKEIRSSGGDENNGQNKEISIDGDDGSPGLQPNHALVRFDGIVGGADGRITPGTQIDSAFLNLNVVNPGSGFEVFRLVTGWDESTTWADFGGDGVTPGDEAAPTPTTAVGANNGGANVGEGVLQLDITQDVQAWIDGETNWGVGLVAFPNGTNGIDFTTSESSSPPFLLVRTLLPGLAKVEFTQGDAGYTGARDTQIREADPDGSYADAASVSVDADDPNGAENHVLIRFDGLFAEGPDAVPADRPIVKATLSVSAFNPGDGGSVHRMLVDWQDDVTWAGAFGGDGVQADDAEAVAIADAFVVGEVGRIDIDVTASLQAWREAPGSNLGWVILPSGGNGWDFSTSEAAPGARPTLTVVFEETPAPPCDGDADGDLDVDSEDLNILLAAFGDRGDDIPADVNADGVVDSTDLNVILAAFGTACIAG